MIPKTLIQHIHNNIKKIYKISNSLNSKTEKLLNIAFFLQVSFTTIRKWKKLNSYMKLSFILYYVVEPLVIFLLVSSIIDFNLANGDFFFESLQSSNSDNLPVYVGGRYT